MGVVPHLYVSQVSYEGKDKVNVQSVSATEDYSDGAGISSASSNEQLVIKSTSRLCCLPTMYVCVLLCVRINSSMCGSLCKPSKKMFFILAQNRFSYQVSSNSPN